MRNSIALLAILILGTGCLQGGGPSKPDNRATVNQAPTLQGSPPAEVMATDVYSFTPTVQGATGNTLRFSVTGLPPWASFDTKTGAINGTPAARDVGQYSNISITVSDGSNSVSLPPFSITVTDIVYGSITLSWIAPTQYTDGSPLTDLDGFRLYWGRTAGRYTHNLTIDNESISTYVLENIPIGRYAFAATAFNSEGVESRYSVPMHAVVR